MIFKIEFPYLERRIGEVFFNQLEYLVARALLNSRQALQIRESAQRLKHILCRSASTIAVAEQHCAVVARS